MFHVVIKNLVRECIHNALCRRMIRIIFTLDSVYYYIWTLIT